ncbi:MAG: GNAT family N-acetyltransferase [Nitriliruptoraceae bacterium]
MEQTVEITQVGDRQSIDAVLRLIQPADDSFGLTLVDEAEIVALTAAARSGELPRDGLSRLIFRSNGQLVGYVAYNSSSGDLAASSPHLDACLAQLASVDKAPTRVWIRGVAPGDWQSLATYGTVARRLAVCARTLPVAASSQIGRDDVTVRAFVAGQDDARVVAVLARAYAGTPDGTWDEEQFAKRQNYPWFRTSDLLLAEDADGTVLGLHWLKRRDATTGEVYNLAVDPAHAGRGIGALLLAKGLEHLYANGLTQVVLWVDADNHPAVTLYTGAGFVVHTLDVELELAKP